MKLTRATEYGILGLISLVKKNKATNIEELAKDQKVSSVFLKKIFQKLSKNNLVIGSRGKEGGFVLAKKPNTISILDIIEAIEGPIAINHCLEKGNNCCDKKICHIIKVWETAQNSMTKVFAKTKLTNLI